MCRRRADPLHAAGVRFFDFANLPDAVLNSEAAHPTKSPTSSATSTGLMTLPSVAWRKGEVMARPTTCFKPRTKAASSEAGRAGSPQARQSYVYEACDCTTFYCFTTGCAPSVQRRPWWQLSVGTLSCQRHKLRQRSGQDSAKRNEVALEAGGDTQHQHQSCYSTLSLII